MCNLLKVKRNFGIKVNILYIFVLCQRVVINFTIDHNIIVLALIFDYANIDFTIDHNIIVLALIFDYANIDFTVDHNIIVLALIFDYTNDWNNKNKEQVPKGRFQEPGTRNIYVYTYKQVLYIVCLSKE